MEQTKQSKAKEKMKEKKSASGSSCRAAMPLFSYWAVSLFCLFCLLLALSFPIRGFVLSSFTLAALGRGDTWTAGVLLYSFLPLSLSLLKKESSKTGRTNATTTARSYHALLLTATAPNPPTTQPLQQPPQSIPPNKHTKISNL